MPDRTSQPSPLTAFRTRDVHWIGEQKWRRYAVLLPLFRKKGEVHVLFEKRARTLHQQPSETSFPGGRIEARETAQEAAVRETCEELCVIKEQIRIFGPADRYLSHTHRKIEPFIGALDEYRGTYSADEVAYPFSVPISALMEMEPTVYRNTLVQTADEHFPYDLVPGGKEYPWEYGTHEILFYHWGEEVIWGITARILHAALPLIRTYRLAEYV